MIESTLNYPWSSPPQAACRVAVAPGVHWLRMPLPFALDHINLWLLDDGADGWCAVDTGFALDEVMGHWRRLLAADDARRLRRIIVTHFHPDHLGLADWLCRETGAGLIMSHGEFVTGHAVWHALPGHDPAATVALFEAHGLDAERCEALRRRGNGYRRGVASLPTDFERLFDGQVLHIGGRSWRALVGHGHSPEHMALYCEALGVLISGDMLLPRISTNVSVFAASPDADPLTWFLDSLHRIKDLPADTLVLPSHGFPFHGLHARVAQLEQHHRERCEQLLAACDRPRCAGDLLQVMFPRELDTHQVMFAMGEAIAHLNHLTHQGTLSCTEDGDGRMRYFRTELTRR
ncbi:MAG: MBL fold metallo-hydrolase [Rhodocyclaceae bacterium]|nr:MBL fold metallo-hydrolase [Rhodocyclaceae bacterium]